MYFKIPLNPYTSLRSGLKFHNWQIRDTCLVSHCLSRLLIIQFNVSASDFHFSFVLLDYRLQVLRLPFQPSSFSITDVINLQLSPPPPLKLCKASAAASIKAPINLRIGPSSSASIPGSRHDFNFSFRSQVLLT
ncbi:hypothetical protein L2E82_29172 [Cichorium intybus]|uniref:Uncharacterized protein n=1 Tax=Cichorium intybus TaxID=13427 RepID=A0ACB9CX55_CICIN|nr:hypothetical protein L2E82_29172 [Cichorium intybus]